MDNDELEYLPDDWESPNWEYYERVHGWRNYVSEDVQKEWPRFTEYQKKILAIEYSMSARRESWD